MRIPPEKLDEIAQANDIVDVISEYLKVTKRGKSTLALCPFHPDKNPSLHISQQKQVYHCFSCKSSGNVFTFVQNYEKITFMDAAQKLAQRAGIELRTYDRDPDVSNEISKLYEINTSAAKFFRKNLQNLSGGEKDFIYNYLDKRKIDSKLIDKFGIGYSMNSWDSLMNHFLEENFFSREDLEKAGLLVKKEGDTGYYDRFRGRLMFPIFNENNKVVGFGGRKLFEDDQTGKYINSPETKIYNKSKILYGLNFSKDKIRYSDHVILVEGYMDLISLSKHGIENTVASSGTALTYDQVKLISRYTKNIHVLFDSDLAGIKAARRGIEIILEAGLDLNVILLPENEDPDSFINKYGKEEFEKLISKRKSIIEFISELYKKEGRLESVSDKTEFVKEIIGYIGKIPDKIKRAFYVKEISKLYSLYESDLRDELGKVVNDTKKKMFTQTSVVIPETKNGNTKSDPGKISQEERDLLELFVHGNEEVISYLENNIHVEFIKNKTVLKMVEFFLDECIEHGKIEISKTINELENEDMRNLLSNIAVSKHEASYFENPGSDRLLNASVEQKYNLKFAKDVIRKLKVRELEAQRMELKRDPENFQKVFELTKEINKLLSS